MEPQQQEESQIQPKARSRSRKSEPKAPTLNIPEKLFILTIDDDEGAIASSVKSKLRYGLAGAFLAELALQKIILVEEDRVVLSDPSPTGDTLYDDVLAMIMAEKKPRRLSHWIGVIGSKQTTKKVAARLAERNVISIEKKRYTWISPYIFYPQMDASAKYWIKHHLRAVVLAGEKNEPPDIILLSLLRACRLLRLVFTTDELMAASKKVDTIVQGEDFGEAVAKLLEKK